MASKKTNAKVLHNLISRGDLDALLEYIEAGKPLRVKYGQLNRLKSALEFAVQQRFYSQVKLLLEEVEWQDVELRWCLEYAMDKGRGDLVRLLIKNGAPRSHIPPEQILRSMDMETISAFVEQGINPCQDNAFAKVLEATKAKPMLHFYRKYHEQFPCLRPQLSQSLVIALIHENARWISLLIWAGADLDIEVEVPLSGDYDETYPEMLRMTPREAMKGVTTPEVLKILNMPETPEIRQRRLNRAAYYPEKQAFQELMKRSSVEDLNSGDRGGSPALEFIVDENCHDLSKYLPSQDGKKEQWETLNRTKILLKAGAKWLPSHDSIQKTRRNLITHDGDYIVRLLRLLLSFPKAIEISDIWELCRTQTIRRKLLDADPDFWEEICRLSAKKGNRGARIILVRLLRAKKSK